MTHLARQLASATILTFATLSLAGCLGASIAQECDDIAASACARCERCAVPAVDGLPPISGAELCGLAPGDTLAQCEQTIGRTCTNEASATKDPNVTIDACAEVIADASCEDLYEAYALKRRPGPDACTLLL